MRNDLARWSYGVLLRVDPRGFREEFGGEMLAVFDEAAERYRAWWLVGEVALSVGRQRVLRGTEERREIAAGLLAGSYPDSWPPNLRAGKLVLAVMLSLTSFWLFPQGQRVQAHMGRAHGVVRGR